jgi:superfamily II DNA or RNA helicase
MTLRPAQVIFRDSLRREAARVRAVLGVAACGFGKGVVMQNILVGAMTKNKHALMLVHGRDRVNDAHERATKLGIPHGVLMGSKKRERWHSIQIASSDTVHRMEHKPKADLIIIDECHLGLSPTFRGVLDCYPDAKIIGLTATPMLGNGKPLGRASGGIFDAMVTGPSVKQLIADGCLVRSEVIATPPPADLGGLRKMKTGEFDAEQGQIICDTPAILGDMVEHYQRHASHLKAVSFGFTQKHAFDICESFNRAGVNWAYIDANTPDGDIHTPGTRKFIFHQYDHGDLRGISSCQTISIGWDHSACKCLIFGSKTASFPLYHQRLGRGSRPHKGHDHFRVHDHTGNWLEFIKKGPFFESDIEWQLDGPAKFDEKKMSTCDEPVPASEPHPLFTGDFIDGIMFPCRRPYESDPKLTNCPHCGIPLLKEVRETAERMEAERVAGELVNLTAELRAEIEARIREESERKVFFLEQMKIQKQKNYARKYAVARFKQKFGDWPPRGWNREVEFAAGLRESLR